MTFTENLKTIHTKFSTIVAGLGATAVLAWSQMPASMQTDLFVAFPKLKAIAPVAWFAAFVIARAIPQTPKA